MISIGATLRNRIVLARNITRFQSVLSHSKPIPDINSNSDEDLKIVDELLNTDNSNQLKKRDRRPSYENPISLLRKQLTENLDSTSDVSSSYDLLKKGIRRIQEETANPDYVKKSYGLNIPLVKLLDKATDSVRKNTPEMEVDPYQILDTLCQNEIAHSQHFEILLKSLLSQDRPHDVLALWVRYLQTITENPKALTTQAFKKNHRNQEVFYNPHLENIALTSVAYLLLPNSTPNIQTLYEILRLDKGKGDVLPFNYVKKVIFNVVAESQKPLAFAGFDKLFNQYIRADKESFLKKLDNTIQLSQLREYYKTYTAIKTDLDGEILAKCMDKYIEFGNPSEAVSIYTKSKNVELNSIFLKNSLLVAVANLPADSRASRLKRVMAVWNSLIKPVNPNAASYAALIKAVNESRNLDELKIIWKNDIPSTVKEDAIVKEAYLTAIINDPAEKFNVKELPENIQSLSLINAILIKLAADSEVTKESFDEFYNKYFSKDSPMRKTPDLETKAIKMFASYQHTEDKSSFQFFHSISLNPRDFKRSLAIINDFIRVVPSIEPIRAFYAEAKEPFDARRYNSFINAEFEKKDGSSDVAEEIFHEFTKNASESKATMDKYKEPLETLMKGFSFLATKHRNTSLLLKVDTYLQLARKLKLDVNFAVLAKILFTISYLARGNSGKFTEEELAAIQSISKYIQGNKSFTPNERDVQILQKNGINFFSTKKEGEISETST